MPYHHYTLGDGKNMFLKIGKYIRISQNVAVIAITSSLVVTGRLRIKVFQN